MTYTQWEGMTKPVQLSDEAYDRLKMTKRPGESFSDVVLRLTGRASLLRLRGLRSAREIDEAERQISRIDRMDRPSRQGPR